MIKLTSLKLILELNLKKYDAIFELGTNSMVGGVSFLSSDIFILSFSSPLFFLRFEFKKISIYEEK